MEQNFTLNQCVRLIYGETTPEESMMLSEIISGNDALKAEVAAMRKSYDVLSSLCLNPDADVVKSILKYSRDTALHLSC
jgi:anti-sigma factor RsiW